MKPKPTPKYKSNEKLKSNNELLSKLREQATGLSTHVQKDQTMIAAADRIEALVTTLVTTLIELEIEVQTLRAK